MALKEKRFLIEHFKFRKESTACKNWLAKIKNLTNWKPRIKLDNGLKKTIKWIRDNYSEYSEKYEI